MSEPIETINGYEANVEVAEDKVWVKVRHESGDFTSTILLSPRQASMLSMALEWAAERIYADARDKSRDRQKANK